MLPLCFQGQHPLCSLQHMPLKGVCAMHCGYYHPSICRLCPVEHTQTRKYTHARTHRCTLHLLMQDGRTYWHCDMCQKCIKPGNANNCLCCVRVLHWCVVCTQICMFTACLLLAGRVHCEECGKCELPAHVCGMLSLNLAAPFILSDVMKYMWYERMYVCTYMVVQSF